MSETATAIATTPSIFFPLSNSKSSNGHTVIICEKEFGICLELIRYHRPIEKLDPCIVTRDQNQET